MLYVQVTSLKSTNK